MAFARYYRRHYGAILAFVVRRLEDRETAREVALDVFRLAWAEYDAESEPAPAWLFSVARNLIGDAYRRRAREGRLLAALRDEPDSGDAASATDRRVREVLEALPVPAREVLILKYWDGMSAGQMGTLLGCSPAAVWVRLHRARRAFASAWTGPDACLGAREELA